MRTYQDKLFVLIRISLGWLMLFAGYVKVANPAWSAAGYLSSAKTFSGFYSWLASPGVIDVVNFLNAWGLFLLGMSLILGVFVRLTAPLGALLMALYWLPVLNFPKVGEHGMVVDDHVIYALLLLILAAVKAGRIMGIDSWLANHPKFKEHRVIKLLV